MGAEGQLYVKGRDIQPSAVKPVTKHLTPHPHKTHTKIGKRCLRSAVGGGGWRWVGGNHALFEPKEQLVTIVYTQNANVMWSLVARNFAQSNQPNRSKFQLDVLH